MRRVLISVFWFAAAATAAIDGTWKASTDGPSGPIEWTFVFKVDGAKLSGETITHHDGKFPIQDGKVDGDSLSFTVTVNMHGADMTMSCKGKVSADTIQLSSEMAGHHFEWKGKRQPAAQTARPAVLGTVRDFGVGGFEIGVKTDKGIIAYVKFGPETDIVMAPPGERDLKKAKAAKVTDISAGDRVLISFVPEMDEARRIVVIPASEIVRRNEAERLDWQKRGIWGAATATNGKEITLKMQTPAGAQTAKVIITNKTKIRRYAPDTVKFSDARATSIAEIAAGDQVRARGPKSRDGLSMTADEVVFGTFLTATGTITAVNPKTKEITIQNLATKKPLTVRLIDDSQLKLLPGMKTMFSHKSAGGGPPDLRGGDIMAQVLERLPQGTIDDLKVGGAVVASSTKGTKSDAVTAILLIGNAEMVLQMIQSQGAPNVSGMPAGMSNMHGMIGPGGLTLPGMVP